MSQAKACWLNCVFEQPVFALAGDRFILRDWSEQWTLAGGLVLDPEGDRKKISQPGAANISKALFAIHPRGVDVGGRATGSGRRGAPPGFAR